jgi:hypothetical protein
MLTGGGVRPGQVLGQSDRHGAYPVLGRVCSPGDVCATIYHCLGIDPHQLTTDQLGKPLPLTHGKPIHEVM